IRRFDAFVCLICDVCLFLCLWGFFFFFYLCVVWFVFFFFFSSRRRHTRFDCDWSSDVCSSDLGMRFKLWPVYTVERFPWVQVPQIGRASCREKSVDLGGRRIIKKKKKKKKKKLKNEQRKRKNKT